MGSIGVRIHYSEFDKGKDEHYSKTTRHQNIDDQPVQRYLHAHPHV